MADGRCATGSLLTSFPPVIQVSSSSKRCLTLLLALPPPALVMRGRLRHRWGPLPAAFVEAQKPPEPAAEPQQQGDDASSAATEPPAKRRRRSRWADRAAEEAVGGDADKQIVLFPSEVVLSNGVKVVLPPAVTGRAPGGDPEVLELHRKVGNVPLLPGWEQSLGQQVV